MDEDSLFRHAQECPSAFNTVHQNGVRCCGRKLNVASCELVMAPHSQPKAQIIVKYAAE